MLVEQSGLSSDMTTKKVYTKFGQEDKHAMCDQNSENPCSTSRAHATNEGVGLECRDGEKGPMHACRQGSRPP
jgi:hypothetical protein